jgi:archaellum component FlaC
MQIKRRDIVASHGDLFEFKKFMRSRKVTLMTGINSDDIILRQIQMIGYGAAKSIGNLNSISSDSLINVVLFIFSKIPQTAGRLPGQPPAAKSALFKFATTVVNLIAGLGYAEDLRYDNFLYPKGDITRSMLRFLLDKVPRAAASGPAAATSATSQLALSIVAAQSTFAEAQRKKTDRAPLAQPLVALNKGLKPAVVDQISKISGEPKIAFYGAPIAPNGIPFNQQSGTHVFASLLAQNDRDISFDFSAVPAAGGGKIRTVVKRAFAVAAAATTEAVAPVQVQASVPTAKVTSLLENKARFEFGVSDTRIGAQAVGPAPAATGAKKAGADGDAGRAGAGPGGAGGAVGGAAGGVNAHADAAVGGGAGAQAAAPAAPEEPKEPKLTVDEVATLKAELQEEIDQARARLAAFEEQVAKLEQQIEVEREQIARVHEQCQAVSLENEKLKQQAEQLAHVAEVSSADSSQIQKLQRDLLDSTGTIMEIANQWEPRRSALIAEYRSLSTALRMRNAERGQIMKKLEKLQRQIRESTERVAAADSSIAEIQTALGGRGDQLDRHHYIEMIFEMIRKIQKHEQEVEKVRVDIRSQHQRMNQTIETVKRTWSLLDETVYMAANKGKGEDWIKKTYKQVVELLTLYESISEDVERTGKLTAQGMELESKIARVEQQSDPEALARITADLEVLKQEIASLGGSV